MLTNRHGYCFILTLFCLASQFRCNAAQRGVEPEPVPEQRKSPAIEAIHTVANGEPVAQKEENISPRYNISLKHYRTKPDSDVPNIETKISDNEFGNVHPKPGDPTQLFYDRGSGRYNQFDPKEIRRRNSLLAKNGQRPAKRKLTTSFDIMSSMYNNTADQMILANGRKKEPDELRPNLTVTAHRLNLTVNVPKLDLCVHVCLAHERCVGAVFDVRKAACKLRDTIDDVIDLQLPPIAIDVNPYDNNDVKFFTVNHKMLTNIIGKCAGRPCKNGTFCSQLIPSGYACLPLAQFLHRIQKRGVQPDKEKRTFHGGKLVRKKRSLDERNTEWRPLHHVRQKRATNKGTVDCGLPPTFPKALSLFAKTTVGAKATYYCEEGVHTKSASIVIKCQPNGKWSTPKFQCIRAIQCATPRKIPGTVMHFYGSNGKKMIKYVCKNNPKASSTTICDPRDGNWRPLRLNCNSQTLSSKKSSVIVSKTLRDSAKPKYMAGLNPKRSPSDFEDSSTNTKSNGTDEEDNSGVNNETQSTQEDSNEYNSTFETSPGSNETADSYNITERDLGQEGDFNTSTMPDSNVTSDSYNTTDVDLGEGEGFNTSTNPESNVTSDTYDTADFDSGQDAGSNGTSKDDNITTEPDDGDDSDGVKNKPSGGETTQTDPLPSGIITADINRGVGLPGYFCRHPSVLTFARSFYNSRNIGSKAFYQCRQYYYSSPEPYCHIVTCLSHGFWSELSMSCSDLDCINDLHIYEGKRMCSSSGFACKRWDEVITDPKIKSTLYFPDGNISMARNYCRDPLHNGFLWCFTKEPTVIWDTCDIPACP